jgi:hypothetical protein
MHYMSLSLAALLMHNGSRRANTRAHILGQLPADPLPQLLPNFSPCVKAHHKRRWAFPLVLPSICLRVSRPNALFSAHQQLLPQHDVASQMSASPSASFISGFSPCEQAHHERRAARSPWCCPACAIPLSRPTALVAHMGDCCPDILDTDAWSQVRPYGTHVRRCCLACAI